MYEIVDPGSSAYARHLTEPIHIDMSALIAQLNDAIEQDPCVICDSRPRGFGKSWAVDMTCAYYDRYAQRRGHFERGAVTSHPLFDTYFGAFDVIHLDMRAAFAGAVDPIRSLARLRMRCCRELAYRFPDEIDDTCSDVYQLMRQACRHGRRQFIVIVDDWDYPLQAMWDNDSSVNAYTEFLKEIAAPGFTTALCYMTGTLPLSMLWAWSLGFNVIEYTMMDSRMRYPWKSFSGDNVRALCSGWGRDFEKLRNAYGDAGPCQVGGASGVYESYRPSSVVRALITGNYRCYADLSAICQPWSFLIDLSIREMPLTIALLLAGGEAALNPKNSRRGTLEYIKTLDGQLELLVHLGALANDPQSNMVYVPNSEAADLLEQLCGISTKPVSPFGNPFK